MIPISNRNSIFLSKESQSTSVYDNILELPVFSGLLHVTGKLYNMMLYRSGIRARNLRGDRHWLGGVALYEAIRNTKCIWKVWRHQTKSVTRSCKSEEDKQCNVQKDKGQERKTIINKILHRSLIKSK
jgi:hypothetical protein